MPVNPADIFEKLERESGIKLTENVIGDLPISGGDNGEGGHSDFNIEYKKNNKVSHKNPMITSENNNTTYNNTKDLSGSEIYGNSHEKEKVSRPQNVGVKASKDSFGPKNQKTSLQGGTSHAHGSRDTNLEKRYSEDVDERPVFQMKPKYKKIKSGKKVSLQKRPKAQNVRFENSENYPNKANRQSEENSALNHLMYDSNIDEDQMLDEHLMAISEMARGKYGSSEHIDEILQKQRKKYRFQLRDYMKHLRTVIFSPFPDENNFCL